MKKLIKKYLLGDFINDVDNQLNKLGEWGKLGVLILDPTGISSWGDAKNAINNFEKDKTILNAGMVGLATLGVIPGTNFIKPLKLLGKTSKGVKSIKIASKIDEPIEKILKDYATKSKSLQKASKYEKLELKKSTIEKLKKIKYNGPIFSIDDIVSKTGDINFENFELLLSNIYENIPSLELKKVISKNKRHSEITKSALGHSLEVAKSASNLPTPIGVTKQEFVFSALMHDLGKMITTEEHLHGPIGSHIIKLIIPELNPVVLQSIGDHMSRKQFLSPLQKAIHTADILNGKSELEVLKEIKNLTHDDLLYPTAERIEILKDHGNDLSLRRSAEKQGVIDRVTLNSQTPEFISNGDGTFRLNVKDNNIPINNNGKTSKEIALDVRKELETSYDIESHKNISELGHNSARLPKYSNDELKYLANWYLKDSPEVKLLREAISYGDEDAIHVLLNLKYAATHNLDLPKKLLRRGEKSRTIIPVLGRSASDPMATKWTPGQISDVVDFFKQGEFARQGYNGKVTPIIKGNGMFEGRARGYTTVSEFGDMAYTTNSDKVAARYADLRVLEKGVSYDKYLEGLPKLILQKARDKIAEILRFQRKHNIKQGNWDLNINKTHYRSGTYENLPPELYKPENIHILNELIKKYDELLHILGNHNMQVGGTRRGILKLRPNIITLDYKRRTYKGWISKNHPFYPYSKESFKDHNIYTTMLHLLGYKQGATLNIGETIQDALDKGAPYGIDFMSDVADITTSRWKYGGKLIPKHSVGKILSILNPKTFSASDDVISFVRAGHFPTLSTRQAIPKYFLKDPKTGNYILKVLDRNPINWKSGKLSKEGKLLLKSMPKGDILEQFTDAMVPVNYAPGVKYAVKGLDDPALPYYCVKNFTEDFNYVKKY